MAYLSVGVNDLATINPSLAAQWNYKKNDKLTPKDVTAHNNRKVWWICDFGHEWNATIASRSDGHGCPFCSGRFPIKGVTDLQSLRSELSLEWNYDKNEGLKPSDVQKS